MTSCILSVLLLSASSDKGTIDHLDLLSFAVQYAPRIQLITHLHQLHFTFTQSNMYSDQYNKYFIKMAEISYEWMLGLFRLFGKISKYLPKNDSETITQKKCGQHLQSCLGHIWHCLTSWHHKAASNEPQVDQIPSTSGRLSTCYKPRQARLMTFMEHLVCRKQLCLLCLIQMCLLCGKTCCYFLSFCGALWFVLTKKVVLSPHSLSNVSEHTWVLFVKRFWNNIDSIMSICTKI